MARANEMCRSLRTACSSAALKRLLVSLLSLALLAGVMVAPDTSAQAAVPTAKVEKQAADSVHSTKPVAKKKTAKSQKKSKKKSNKKKAKKKVSLGILLGSLASLITAKKPGYTAPGFSGKSAKLDPSSKRSLTNIATLAARSWKSGAVVELEVTTTRPSKGVDLDSDTSAKPQSVSRTVWEKRAKGLVATIKSAGFQGRVINSLEDTASSRLATRASTAITQLYVVSRSTNNPMNLKAPHLKVWQDDSLAQVSIDNINDILQTADGCNGQLWCATYFTPDHFDLHWSVNAPGFWAGRITYQEVKDPKYANIAPGINISGLQPGDVVDVSVYGSFSNPGISPKASDTDMMAVKITIPVPPKQYTVKLNPNFHWLVDGNSDASCALDVPASVRGKQAVTSAIPQQLPAVSTYWPTMKCKQGSTWSSSNTDPVFLGWNTKADGTGTWYADQAVFMFDSDMDLYAIWGSKIKFDGNGAASGTMPDQKAQFNNSYLTLPANAFVGDNADFAGWNTKPDGTGASFANRDIFTTLGNVTLYAQWQKKLRVIFLPNAPQGDVYIMGSMPDQISKVPAALTKNAFQSYNSIYVFTGWNTEPNGTGTAYSDQAQFPFTNDTVLFAQWTTQNAVVTFDGNGATAGSMPDQSSSPNVAAPLNANAYSRTGYVFTGWNTNPYGSATQYADGAQFPFNQFLTLYAQWRPVKVTYDANGGSGSMPDQSSGQQAALFDNQFFAPTGLFFAGWNTRPDNTGTAYANRAQFPFTQDTTLYAQWGHKVFFNAHGGSGTAPDQIAVGTAGLTKNTATWAGHTFLGWNTDPSGAGTAYADQASFSFTSDATLFAQWSHKVIFDKNGGSGTMADQASAVTAALNAHTFTLSGSVFMGWNTRADGSGTAFADQAQFPFAADTTQLAQDVTLYAQWGHAVVFDSNGGSGSMPNQTSMTAAALSQNTFTNSGTVFMGWNTQPDGSGSDYADQAQYLFASNITMYAQWGHTVTFDSHGGSGSMPSQSSSASAALTANTFTNSGTAFTGWNTQPDGSGTAYADQAQFPFAANVTLYAQWGYTVTFDFNGGSGSMPAQSSSVATALNKNTFTRAGYVFVGWNAGQDGKGTQCADQEQFAFTGNTTLYAMWRPVIVTFDANGGVGSQQQQQSTVPAALMVNPYKKDGEVFTTWNTKANGSGTSYADQAQFPFTEDTTLYAQWRAVKVTFDANGGSGSMPDQSASGTTALSQNTFTRNGFAFKEWNTLPDGTGTAYADQAQFPFTAATTLFAQWGHGVIFDSNGGSGTMPTQVSSTATALNKNTFTNSGSVFMGWNTRPDGSETAYADRAQFSFASNITLFAQWGHGVAFDANGGSGSMPAQASNVAAALSKNTFTRPGYVFIGWNTGQDGKGTQYADQAQYPFTGDETLYAMWRVVTVTFDANGGIGPQQQQQSSVATALMENPFKQDGETFTSWNTKANGSGTSYADKAQFPFTEDTTLYAQWRAVQVTFDANGGTGTMPQQSSNVPANLIPNTFTQQGSFNTFLGWNTATDGSGDFYADGAQYSFVQDLTLYAQWISVVYAVNFKKLDPTVTGIMPTQTSSEPANLSPNTFAKPGYVFVGWSTSQDGTGEFFADQALYPFDEQHAFVNLYPVWGHKVSFDSNGGAGSMPDQASGNRVAANLSVNTFTKADYAFTGWNTQQNGFGTAYGDGQSYPFEVDETLYAQWGHKVVFDANGGAGSMPDQVADEDTIAALNGNAFTRSGFVFTGWNTHSTGDGIAYADNAQFQFAANTTVYAQWRAVQVTFDSNGGSGSMPQQSSSTPTALDLNTFTQSGNAFAGWNTRANGSGTAYADGSDYPFAADETLYAQWGHKVIFDSNGGSGSMPDQVSKATVALNQNTFTAPSGTSFAGWNTSERGTGTAYADQAQFTFTADTTLYAQWALPKVTFDANGGTGSMPAQTSSTPAALNANVLTRSQWTFMGWNTQQDGLGKAYADQAEFPFTETLTLYAQWGHQVTFDGNGEGVSGSMSAQVAGDGVATALTTSTFARSYFGGLGWNHFYFTGWNTEPGGTGTAYADGAQFTFDHNQTLYAQWVAPKVIFSSNGGSGSMSDQVSSVNFNLAPNLFTRAGFVFLGWNTKPDGGGTSYTNNAMYSFFDADAVVTLYAQWGHTVSFDGNGGDGSMPDQISGDEVAAALTANTFTRTAGGWEFAGWNTKQDGTGTAYADNSTFPFSANAVMYAQWAHRLTYNANGGSGTMTDDVSGHVITVKANQFTRPGTVFMSWNTQADGYGTDVAAGSTMNLGDPFPYRNLYAIWGYTITFNANGGSGSMPDQIRRVDQGASTILNTNTFTRSNYDFNGWNTKKDGTGTAFTLFDIQQRAYWNLTSNITLYAQWKAK